jgi:hypothetical protein
LTKNIFCKDSAGAALGISFAGSDFLGNEDSVLAIGSIELTACEGTFTGTIVAGSGGAIMVASAVVVDAVSLRAGIDDAIAVSLRAGIDDAIAVSLRAGIDDAIAVSLVAIA